MASQRVASLWFLAFLTSAMCTRTSLRRQWAERLAGAYPQGGVPQQVLDPAQDEVLDPADTEQPGAFVAPPPAQAWSVPQTPPAWGSPPAQGRVPPPTAQAWVAPQPAPVQMHAAPQPSQAWAAGQPQALPMAVPLPPQPQAWAAPQQQQLQAFTASQPTQARAAPPPQPWVAPQPAPVQMRAAPSAQQARIVPQPAPVQLRSAPTSQEAPAAPQPLPAQAPQPTQPRVAPPVPQAWIAPKPVQEPVAAPPKPAVVVPQTGGASDPSSAFAQLRELEMEFEQISANDQTHMRKLLFNVQLRAVLKKKLEGELKHLDTDSGFLQGAISRVKEMEAAERKGASVPDKTVQALLELKKQLSDVTGVSSETIAHDVLDRITKMESDIVQIRKNDEHEIASLVANSQARTRLERTIEEQKKKLDSTSGVLLNDLTKIASLADTSSKSQPRKVVRPLPQDDDASDVDADQ